MYSRLHSSGIAATLASIRRNAWNEKNGMKQCNLQMQTQTVAKEAAKHHCLKRHFNLTFTMEDGEGRGGGGWEGEGVEGGACYP